MLLIAALYSAPSRAHPLLALILLNPGRHQVHTRPQRLRNLSRGAREPLPRPQDPGTRGADSNNADSDDGVVERLARDGVGGRQDEEDSNRHDPRHRDEGNDAAQRAEVEGALHSRELAVPDEAQQDGDAVADVQSNRRNARRRGERNAAAERGQRQDEAQRGGEPDGAHGALKADVDVVEEGVDAAVAREGEHHARVARHAEEAAVPHAEDDETEEHERAVLAEDVDQDLQHRLPVGGGEGRLEVLDREEEGEQHEEPEEGAEADGGDHADGGGPGRVARLFGEVGGGVEAGEAGWCTVSFEA